jgi:hypothetical protein
MRTLIIVVLAVLVVIFLAGTLNVGGASIFQRLDSMLGTDAFMDLHDSIFFFLYRARDHADSELSRAKSDLRKNRPVLTTKAIDEKSTTSQSKMIQSIRKLNRRTIICSASCSAPLVKCNFSRFPEIALGWG